MLTIRNIDKIVEKTIYIGGSGLAIAKVEDVQRDQLRSSEGAAACQSNVYVVGHKTAPQR